MGRPKLYHTDDDRRRAKQSYSKRYYSNGQLTLQNLESCLMNIIGHSLMSFLDGLILRMSPPDVHTSQVEQLQQAFGQVDGLRVLSNELHTNVLQKDGVCDKLREVEVTRRRISQVIYAMEDVLFHAQGDVDTFVDMHRRSLFTYQMGTDVVPLS
ncbi:hypothetical protein EV363DRAFT_1406121 [Boletus edulis]|nr:hypothetical protein EV363DRAFT_1406121 [Boletus edulis]